MYIVYIYLFFYILAAVGRYFDSISQKNHKESTGKVDKHTMKMLHYSRRKRVNEILVAYVILNR